MVNQQLQMAGETNVFGNGTPLIGDGSATFHTESIFLLLRQGVFLKMAIILKMTSGGKRGRRQGKCGTSVRRLGLPKYGTLGAIDGRTIVILSRV